MVPTLPDLIVALQRRLLIYYRRQEEKTGDGNENMAIRIELSKDRIAAFCRRNHIHSLAFFGSVLRDDFGPNSDVDVMVEFERGHKPGLMQLAMLENELSEILGHKVDIVERHSVERSENYIRRRHILQSVETVYVA